MLEGNDVTVFGIYLRFDECLWRNLLQRIEGCCRGVSQFCGGKRRHHADADHAAGYFLKVIRYLLRDFRFLSREHLCQVFRLCCLVIGIPSSDFQSVTMDLSGSSISKEVFLTSIRLVQSYNFERWLQ